MRSPLISAIMILSLAAGSFFVSRAQGIPVRAATEAGLPYSSGEFLKFTMHYNWGSLDSDIGSGEVRLDTVRLAGQKCFRCKVSGRTTKLYDLFFKVRENFVSCFTCDSLRPLRFTRDTEEGKYIAKNTYKYIWDASNPYIDVDYYTRGGHGGEKNQRLKLPLDRHTYDLPALFFFARNMDFDKVRPGVRHPMTFAVDDEVCHVYFVLYGRERKKVKGLGTVDTIRFGALLLAGEVFNGEAEMTIWISDDDNRIPVCFEAPILVGTVNGRLSGWAGLKHPFTSLHAKK